VKLKTINGVIMWILFSYTVTTTNPLGSTLFTSSANSMEAASVTKCNNSIFNTSSRSSDLATSSGKQANKNVVLLFVFFPVNSVPNFTGLFAASTNATVGANVIASSLNGPQSGNLFGNNQPQTTIMKNTAATTTGQPFTFNIFQPTQATVSSNPTQFSRQVAQPTLNPSSIFTAPFNQPVTQASSSGFNFMANSTTTTPNFSFNLQPSVGGNNSSLFVAPPGGFNLPSNTTTQPRRKAKTPTRNKTKRK